jgi:hypothetical protein
MDNEGIQAFAWAMENLRDDSRSRYHSASMRDSEFSQCRSCGAPPVDGGINNTIHRPLCQWRIAKDALTKLQGEN